MVHFKASSYARLMISIREFEPLERAILVADRDIQNSSIRGSYMFPLSPCVRISPQTFETSAKIRADWYRRFGSNSS